MRPSQTNSEHILNCVVCKPHQSKICRAHSFIPICPYGCRQCTALEKMDVFFCVRKQNCFYMPIKREKYSAQILWVYDKRQFALNRTIYTGRKEDGTRQVGLVANTVKKFCAPFFGTNSIFYIEGYFSSI